jgi:glycosyltransferase involved in cell wall biosynthesis
MVFNMSKKIVFIIDSLHGGGAEKVVLTVASEMAARGLDVHLICTEEGRSYSLPQGVQVHTLSKTRKITPLKFLNRWILAKRLRSLVSRLEQTARFDLAFSCMKTSDFIVKLSGIPEVYPIIQNHLSTQLTEKRKNNSGGRRQLKWVYSGRNLITASNGLAEDIVDNLKIPVRSIRTIYNSFYFDKIIAASKEPFPALDKYAPYVIHVGSFKRQKRHDILLRSFAKSKIPHNLLLVGDGSQEQKEALQSLAKQLGIAEKVIFMGWQDNPHALTRRAELFILSSDYEGFALVIVEALLVGTRVVSTNCPSGPSEILIGELADCLTPVGDVDALSEKIRENVGKPLGDVEYSIGRFRIEKIVEEFLALPTRSAPK